ncbi:hypothetical protein SAMN05421677_102165 [Halobacillus aidingensis]|uniref:Uncharacterized protein n=1 Tax=Halobacillus aidingensis TaxID=240303 RepID=A0A1H0FYR6_HALAD|nr:hypothetical protein SAMN05421677_102165 [Halobacillus aidingensis]
MNLLHFSNVCKSRIKSFHMEVIILFFRIFHKANRPTKIALLSGSVLLLIAGLILLIF